MKTQKILIGIFLILVTTLLVSAADYSRSNPQLTQPGLNSVNYNYGAKVPLSPTQSSCERGQDFLLQVAPFGCTPAVVRSDLLEEQNVPVFCQLAATQINPLIKVDAINYISFKGDMPEGISGVGFHPAQAAINTGTTLLNSPVLENVGYVVIVLDKQKNESSMPDSIKGTLTASIKYDVKNTFGVGRATYYLPELTQPDWEQKFTQYGFWRNKGYLRADSIDTNSATISVYSDTNNKIATTTLAKGKTSAQIDLPGFYCLAGMSLRLDSLDNPTTRAKFNINGEIVEVAEGGQFLENRCTIIDIDKKGLVQETSVRCKSDDEIENFNLRISPRVNLEINGNVKNYEIGDYLYSTSDNEKAIYLGYIGTEKNSEKLEDTYIILMSKPIHSSELSETELTEVTNFDRLTRTSDFGAGIIDAPADLIKIGISGTSRIIKYLSEGKSFGKIAYKKQIAEGFESAAEFKDSKVKIMRFAEPKDSTLNEETVKNYDFAMADYRKIISSFPNTKENDHLMDETQKTEDILAEETFGEQAFFNAIQLAKTTEQKKTMLSLCQEFKEKFPKSKTDLSEECNNPYKNSNAELSVRSILINNQVKSISFEGIYEPSYEEFSAVVRIRNASGKTEQHTLTKDNPIYLGNTNEFIELKDLEQNYAIVRVHILPKGALATATNFISLDSLKLNKNEGVGRGGYVFTVTEINLKRVAKVSVLPKIDNAGTEANFSFDIGIEKRAIQLAPDEIEDRIKTLENFIEDWEKISKDLGGVIKGFNTACLSTGIILTVKNFFDNTGGMSIARNKVMRSEGGWVDICKEKVGAGESSSINDCLLENSNQIDKDVEIRYNSMKDVKITEENKDRETALIATSLGAKIVNPQNSQESINTINIVTSFNYKGENNTIQLSQTRDLKAIENALNNNPSPELKKVLELERYRILSDINVNVQDQVIQKSLVDEISGKEGISSEGSVGIYNRKDSIQGVYDGRTTTQSGFKEIPATKKIQVIVYSGSKYILELDRVKSDEYIVKDVYDINGIKLTSRKEVAELDKQNNRYDANAAEIKRIFTFKEYDKATYQNKFKDPEIKYFETTPYKGMPAQVPFDLQNGWYASMKQTLATGGNIRTYDASGAVSSFYLCNVGQNGKAEFNSGIRDDICRGYNPGTGRIVNAFDGLSKSEENALVRKAVSAINNAQSQYKSGVNTVKIGNQIISVGNPEVGVPEMQCQDFMSPKDCNLLFNVCDPVICPSSRCNLGGTHYVSNVIQSGIIGSIALCLPNMKENIFVPICLTGLKAGIDNLLSVFTGYRDCLETQLESGETVGICDELHSIYLCDFFWREALPFAETIMPRIFESLLGQEGTRGGGEYLGVQSAWDNAQNSVDYMSNYYGRDISAAFKTKIAQEVGGAVCKNFISANYPAGGEILDSLVEPASPPQYTANFNEIPFTTATVPATSQYKVFFHIYAGQESKAFYRVYLKSPSGTSLYQTNPTVEIASGFIDKGGYASETKDFTAPTGYKEVCVNVNGQDNCGFKKVSTSFAIDYLEDKYLEEQAEQTDIKSQVDCVSGTPSLYSFAQPNLQAGISEGINPALYDHGIIRICSTDNPGKGTDANWNTPNARWHQVGSCDGEAGKIKCWLDKKSVEDNIKTTDIREAVLNKTSKNYIDSLLSEGDYLDFAETITDINKLDDEGKTNYITGTLIGKAFFNNQKAKLYLIRGNAYANLALKIYESIKKDKTKLQDPKMTIRPEDLDVIFKDCKGQYPGQCEVAKKIVEIAREVKIADGLKLDESTIKTDTGSNCFEELILMQAMQESRISHCKNELWKGQSFENDFTCDGDVNSVLKPSGENSLGVMQINIDIHKINAQNFETNIRYGASLLIKNLFKGSVTWKCGDDGKDYTGWEAALRRYNGLGCSGADRNKDGIDDAIEYVGKVLGQKSTISSLFGDVCVGISPTTTTIIKTTAEYPIFEYSDGSVALNIFLTFTGTRWVWDTDKDDVKNGNGQSVGDEMGVFDSFKISSTAEEIITLLRDKNYEQGLKILIDKTIETENDFFPGADLFTTNIAFNPDKVFVIEQNNEIVFVQNKRATSWGYSSDRSNWNDDISTSNSALVKSLKDKSLYGGAKIIFDLDKEETIIKKEIERYASIKNLDNAIHQATNLKGSIQDNVDFINYLVSKDIISKSDLIKISNMDDLRNILQERKRIGGEKSEEIEPIKKPIETKKWTYDSAIEKVDEFIKRYGSNARYSYNYDIKTFIDELCDQEFIFEEDCKEINGGQTLFDFNWEENLEYVKKALRKKQLEDIKNQPAKIVITVLNDDGTIAQTIDTKGVVITYDKNGIKQKIPVSKPITVTKSLDNIFGIFIEDFETEFEYIEPIQIEYIDANSDVQIIEFNYAIEIKKEVILTEKESELTKVITRLWNLESALKKVKTLRGKYSDNEKFIDEICSQNIFRENTEKECTEIKGGGILDFNLEEDMIYVKNLLLQIQLSKAQEEIVALKSDPEINKVLIEAELKKKNGISDSEAKEFARVLVSGEFLTENDFNKIENIDDIIFLLERRIGIEKETESIQSTSATYTTENALNEINSDYLLGKFSYSQNPDFALIESHYTTKSNLYLRKDTYNSFKEMYNAAKEEGIELEIISATRGFNSQRLIWEDKWYLSKISDLKERTLDILQYSAMPGTSRHHWGTEIDINNLNNNYFEAGEGKEVYDWMIKNAANFGFCQVYNSKSERPLGYNEKKWHWSYMPSSNEFLRSYLSKINNQMIEGFKGDNVVEEIDIINKYVSSINNACFNLV
jgi:LAS superfamily LD-carboxypeptidase LdcB